VSVNDLRFPRNADRWCGAVVLLVVILSFVCEAWRPA